MVHIQKIESLDLPELEPYRTMRRSFQHHQQGIFVAEGPKLIRRLLESGWPVVSFLMTPDWLGQLHAELAKRPEDIRLFIGEKELLDQLTGYRMWHGVQAVGRIPRSPSLEEILGRVPRPYLFAAVDGVHNAENLGVIVRNCVAFGVQALLVPDSSSSPYLRRAVRGSMGAIFHLPVVEVGSLPEALAKLRAHGIRSIAAHLRSEANTLSKANLAVDCCVIFGNEGQGISPEVMQACDECVLIPMHPGVDSLNVGSASAIFFYEAERQRSAGGG